MEIAGYAITQYKKGLFKYTIGWLDPNYIKRYSIQNAQGEEMVKIWPTNMYMAMFKSWEGIICADCDSEYEKYRVVQKMLK